MCYQGTTNIYYFKQLAFSSLRVQAEKSPAALSNGVTVWLTKSAVEYWFIKTQAWVFIQKLMAWLKRNENVN